MAYEATLGDGSAGGRLIKARVHLLEAPESSTATGLRSGSDRSLTGGCECLSIHLRMDENFYLFIFLRSQPNSGVLHPDSLIVGDLRPLTSGPGVPQVRDDAIQSPSRRSPFIRYACID